VQWTGPVVTRKCAVEAGAVRSWKHPSTGFGELFDDHIGLFVAALNPFSRLSCNTQLLTLTRCLHRPPTTDCNARRVAQQVTVNVEPASNDRLP